MYHQNNKYSGMQIWQKYLHDIFARSPVNDTEYNL